MKLTGKTKEAFLIQNTIRMNVFDSLPEPCQNTLIIEFFDSVGIYIDCGHYRKGKMCSGIEGNNFGFISMGTNHENRTEATNAAIEKANTIYNEN